jgi:L-amino acid N-acyltransferase YncA
MSSYTIRSAHESDATEILAIYAPYVQKTAVTYEYDIPSLMEFASRIKNTLKRFPYLVAEKNNCIIGYAYASPFHERKAYEHSAELSVYIEQNMRGKGAGKALYAALEPLLCAQGITNMYACIAATPRKNDAYLTDASIQFHMHCGFHTAGMFSQCAYKFGLWYNMVYMEKIIVPDKKDDHIANRQFR